MLDKRLVGDVLDAALSTGGDFAEIFAEDRENTAIRMVGGRIETAVTGRDYGIGLRIIKGVNSIYAYTVSSDRGELLSLAKKAAAAVKGTATGKAVDFVIADVKNLSPIKKLPSEVRLSERVELIKRAYQAAKGYSEFISQVTAGTNDSCQKVLIANSKGLWAEDKRVYSRFVTEAIASKGSEMQTGFFGPGAQMGFEFFDDLDVETISKKAAASALLMLNAKNCPGGKMDVIIDNKFGGVIFHEACGHSLEASSVAKGTSVFTGKLGEKIASDVVTAIDDGTVPNAWGSINIDDEGNATRKNVLIEKGVLKSYMVDELNGKRMGMASTGSGRRQSYKYAPTSRMTNTYIANGSSNKDEIIKATEYGLYASLMGGGSVNPATGEFNFAVNEGYIVRNGEIAEPVRGATLIGKGHEVLFRIDMVGNNMDVGQGMCGAESGSVPTNVGQPTIRVKNMLVGGRDE